MHLVFADNFLTASLLSILMPILLLLSLAAWYVYAVKRVPGEEPKALSEQEARALEAGQARPSMTAEQPPQV